MAVGPLTVTASVTSGPVLTGSDATVIVNVANAGTTPTNITSIVPTVAPGGAWYCTQANVVLGDVTQVPAAGNVNMPVSVMFLAPVRLGPSLGSYSVNFTVYTADGSVTTTGSPVSVAVTVPNG